MSKPSLPQGTRDFNAATVQKRQYIFQTIRSVFENFGFQPLETPAMENLETLMGKYGEEGDKLIFKILNNGLDNPEKKEQTTLGFDKILNGKSSTHITERALRYDLTIPFARYVAMHHGSLTFPFKRYQIQPVWRADRPQKGRYREFYQCDADIVGSESLLNEVDLVAIYVTAFQQLQLPIEIKINNRKILLALAQVCGGEEKLIDLTIAIDKLDKIGWEKVQTELSQKGFTETQQAIIEKYLNLSGNNDEKLSQLAVLLGDNEQGQKGVEELKYVLQYHQSTGMNQYLVADFTLARGLNYYTGMIFEVKALEADMGSIGGGGRYNDLTSLFGVPNIPGVGISFGVDRIYDVLEDKKLFPESVQQSTQVLFFNLGEAEAVQAFQLMMALRNKKIACEMYPEKSKFDKQFKYAEKKNIPHIVIIGSDELSQQKCTVKNLINGQQSTIDFNGLLAYHF
ncbi:MAG: histidine--tRNA ligase [Chitinophagia bacterium]|jgi:histidyl-tRNA synthetase|nr:histidine--tRNA ligase [Chitinophagia bacterium]